MGNSVDNAGNVDRSLQLERLAQEQASSQTATQTNASDVDNSTAFSREVWSHADYYQRFRANNPSYLDSSVRTKTTQEGMQAPRQTGAGPSLPPSSSVVPGSSINTGTTDPISALYAGENPAEVPDSTLAIMELARSLFVFDGESGSEAAGRGDRQDSVWGNITQFIKNILPFAGNALDSAKHHVGERYEVEPGQSLQDIVDQILPNGSAEKKAEYLETLMGVNGFFLSDVLACLDPDAPLPSNISELHLPNEQDMQTYMAFKQAYEAGGDMTGANGQNLNEALQSCHNMQKEEDKQAGNKHANNAQNPLLSNKPDAKNGVNFDFSGGSRSENELDNARKKDQRQAVRAHQFVEELEENNRSDQNRQIEESDRENAVERQKRINENDQRVLKQNSLKESYLEGDVEHVDSRSIPSS